MQKLWGGRFTKSTNKLVDEFGASIHFDYKLAKYDIIGSLAHVKMLCECEIITQDDCEKITEGLNQINKLIESGEFNFNVENEDIHLNIEAYLHELIGPVAGKLHTGRSRNDQVATDMHLYLKDTISSIIKKLNVLRQSIIDVCDDNIDSVVVGYTHMQHAQPISFAHHLLAYYEMFTRDVKRFEFNFSSSDVNPLGSAALGGTTYQISRELTTELLGFGGMYSNSIDGVSDRDYLVEFLSNCSLVAMHLSRFCEEIVMWCSEEFKYIELSDDYSTGSSIMPQKKNPDMAELIRGKSGRVYGNLFSLLTTLKGLCLAYNKDMQEDKECVFDSADTILNSLEIMSNMISTMKVNKDQMEKACKSDFSNATELADYLTTKGVTFREAHEIVGKLVLECINKGIYLSDVSIEEYKDINEHIGEDVYQCLDPHVAVSRRDCYGGTSFNQVKLQIEKAKKNLGDCYGK